MNRTDCLEAARKLARRREASFDRNAALIRRARALRRERGLAWKPLCDFFVPHGLLPEAAGVNSLKRDWAYRVSRIAMKRPGLYAPIMKDIAKTVLRRETDPMVFRGEGRSPDEWNQIGNFFRELERASAIRIPSSDPRSYSVVPDANLRQYFDGGWAEQGMLYLIEKVTKEFSKSNGFAHSIFWNVKLAASEPWTTHVMELDAVAFVDDQAYVFEVKTGKLPVRKKWFARWSRFFKPGWSTYILCSTERSDPTKYTPLLLYPVVDFERLFTAKLNEDFSTGPA